jgi:hypothetical protein
MGIKEEEEEEEESSYPSVLCLAAAPSLLLLQYSIFGCHRALHGAFNFIPIFP